MARRPKLRAATTSSARLQRRQANKSCCSCHPLLLARADADNRQEVRRVVTAESSRSTRPDAMTPLSRALSGERLRRWGRYRVGRERDPRPSEVVLLIELVVRKRPSRVAPVDAEVAIGILAAVRRVPGRY